MSLGEKPKEYLLGNKMIEKEQALVKFLAAQKLQQVKQGIVIGAVSAVGCGEFYYLKLISDQNLLFYYKLMMAPPEFLP